MWRFSVRSLLLLIFVCAFVFVFMAIPPNVSRQLKSDLGIPSSRVVSVLVDRVVNVDGKQTRQVIAVEEIPEEKYRLFAARMELDEDLWTYPGEISVFNLDGSEDWLRPELVLDHFPNELDISQFEEDALRH